MPDAGFGSDPPSPGRRQRPSACGESGESADCLGYDPPAPTGGLLTYVDSSDSDYARHPLPTVPTVTTAGGKASTVGVGPGPTSIAVVLAALFAVFVNYLGDQSVPIVVRWGLVVRLRNGRAGRVTTSRTAAMRLRKSTSGQRSISR